MNIQQLIMEDFESGIKRLVNQMVEIKHSTSDELAAHKTTIAELCQVINKLQNRLTALEQKESKCTK